MFHLCCEGLQLQNVVMYVCLLCCAFVTLPCKVSVKVDLTMLVAMIMSLGVGGEELGIVSNAGFSIISAETSCSVSTALISSCRSFPRW
jgi:hypothetical protein